VVHLLLKEDEHFPKPLENCGKITKLRGERGRHSLLMKQKKRLDIYS